jgi:hypothetical protein
VLRAVDFRSTAKTRSTSRAGHCDRPVLFLGPRGLRYSFRFRQLDFEMLRQAAHVRGCKYPSAADPQAGLGYHAVNEYVLQAVSLDAQQAGHVFFQA